MLRYHCKVCGIQFMKNGLLCRLLFVVVTLGWVKCQRPFTGNVISNFDPIPGRYSICQHRSRTPPERGTVFRLRVDKSVRIISQVEVCARVGNSVI